MLSSPLLNWREKCYNTQVLFLMIIMLFSMPHPYTLLSKNIFLCISCITFSFFVNEIFSRCDFICVRTYFAFCIANITFRYSAEPVPFYLQCRLQTMQKYRFYKAFYLGIIFQLRVYEFLLQFCVIHLPIKKQKQKIFKFFRTKIFWAYLILLYKHLADKIDREL